MQVLLNFTLDFSLTTGIISQVLIDLEITHEEFKTIVKEKKSMKKWKKVIEW